jgi:hypothetical protein
VGERHATLFCKKVTTVVIVVFWQQPVIEGFMA